MAKLLLVEDDNNLREIYEARLQAEGYTIVSAKDGEEALVVAKAEKPNLVISDVMMPKISGFEMLDIMRNTDELKDVKVIMLTALGQSDDQQRADKLGADRYLVKSQVTLEDIVKVTHELLEGEAAPAASSVAPKTDTPAPEPAAKPAAPEPAPAPAPAEEVKEEPKPEPDTTASADAAKPAAEEEADVEAKIEDFVAGASSEPTAPTSAAAPAPEPVVDAPATTDDKLMADAVEKLSVGTDEKKAEPDPTGNAAPSAPAAPATPTSIPVSVVPDDTPAEPSETTGGTGSMGHDKIITPLEGSSETKKDIKQLLADEEAKEAGPAPGTTVVSDAAKSDDPEDKPAGSAPGSPGTPPASGIDPNSIAL